MAFKMKDRLSQLRHTACCVRDEFVQEEGEEFLRDFFHIVNELTVSVNELSTEVEKIKDNSRNILTSAKKYEAADERKLLTGKVKVISCRIHTALKLLQEEVAIRKQETNGSTVNFRIKKAQFATLARKFYNVMVEYVEAVGDHREKKKERLLRQLKYTGKRVTEEEVEEMLESNISVIIRDVLIDTARERQACDEKARHIDARHMEISTELYQMLCDLAVLVDEQGEMIDCIEHNVENAPVYVERDDFSCVRTTVHYKKNRRVSERSVMKQQGTGETEPNGFCHGAGFRHVVLAPSFELELLENWSKHNINAVSSLPDTTLTTTSKVDNTLREFEVTNYLQDMNTTQIYHLGLLLGLSHCRVKAYKDSSNFLNDVIAAWLRKVDQVTEKGEPSWIVLISALKHRRVEQPSIANKIAMYKDHQIRGTVSSLPVTTLTTTPKVDTLREQDLVEVTNYLLDMNTSQTYHLGLNLGLKKSNLKVMMKSTTFLDDVIVTWLQKEDEVTAKGEPSWTALISALRHWRVGQATIANKIAKDKVGPLQIIQQPTDQQNVALRSTVEFTVTAATTAAGHLMYQWQLNGADLDPLQEGVSGTTTNTLTIGCVQKRHRGVYKCIVSSTLGSIKTSDPAQLTVCGENLTKAVWVPDAMTKECMLCAQHFTVFVRKHHCRQCGRVVCSSCSPHRQPKAERTCRECFHQLKRGLPAAIDLPQINQQPTDQLNVVPGSTVEFTVTAATTAAGHLMYQWQLNGADLDPLQVGVSGTTTNTLTIGCVQERHRGVYTCIVSSTSGLSTTSDPAQLTVLDPPQIIQQPTNQLNVVPGSTVEFTVTAATTAAEQLTYQWQLNGADLHPLLEGVSGTTTNTLTITGVRERDSGTYTCIVSNAPGSSKISDTAQLTIRRNLKQLLRKGFRQLSFSSPSQEQHPHLHPQLQQVSEPIGMKQQGEPGGTASSIGLFSAWSNKADLRNELKQYTVKAKPRGIELGSGTYGRVIELTLGGKTVAGKVFKTSSFLQPQTIIDKLREELSVMIQVHHPNVVQCKGVCFLKNEAMPVLLMERLMSSLHAYLLDPNNSNMAIERKVGILCDITSGLVYLHSHTPAIIHRDLTGNNILLNSQLKAKIADFGNARIMDLDPEATPKTFTSLPGTLDYMPPEAQCGSGKYDPSLDVFSFGHLSLLTIIQSPVHPLLPSTYPDGKELHARSEVKRREQYLDKAEQLLGEEHSLVELVKQCLHNYPAQRPQTAELKTTLQDILSTLGSVNVSNSQATTCTAEKFGKIKVTPELREIENELRQVSGAKWYQLGVQLGLTPATLDTIQSNYPRDANRCKTEVLIWWLRNAPTCSWQELAQAVEAMGEHAVLADRLKKKMA